MKTRLFTPLIYCLFILCVLVACSCKNVNPKPTQTSQPTSGSSATDSSAMPMDTAAMQQDTSRGEGGSMKVNPIPPNQIPPPPPPNRSPASIDDKPIPVASKGYAMVYCPTKMIIHVPSIVNAEVTKAEVAQAYANFEKTLQEQNPDKTPAAISNDIKGDSIDIYDNMRVALELDPEDFDNISKDENTSQSFAGKQTLDWDWTVKPLHSTRKSIIKFKFFGTNAANSQETEILEKTIDISVQVDARSFFEKWGDFLLDDPKTTLTAILIPVVTFFGGFLTAKKKKESASS